MVNWMRENKLELNPDKMEVMLHGKSDVAFGNDGIRPTISD